VAMIARSYVRLTHLLVASLLFAPRHYCSLVFLDEPTSGLDSYSAHQCVSLLKKLSSSGRCTVLCTIHQPSSEVFLQFDNAIVLKSGRVIYGGPVVDMQTHFSTCGFPVPDLTNPADHAMFTVQINEDAELEKAGLFQIEAGKVERTSTTGGGDAKGKDIEPVVTASFMTQLDWLMRREMNALVRDKAALIGRFGEREERSDDRILLEHNI